MIHVRSGWPLKAFCRKLAIVLKLHKGAHRTLQRLNGSLLFQTSASQAHVAQGEVEVRLLWRSSTQQAKRSVFQMSISMRPIVRLFVVTGARVTEERTSPIQQG